MVKFVLIGALAGALLLAACGGGDDDGGDGEDNGAVNTTEAGFAATPGEGGDNGDDDSGNGDAGDGDTTGAAPTVNPNAQATLIPVPTLPAGKKMYDSPPPLTIDTSKRYFATIRMDIGDIKLELFPQDAPQHVNNFVFLSREGFYDGIVFHRVVSGFVAQAGDPTGTGRGGPGYTIADEVNARKFEDGTLGMAKTSAPNSAGSQWFIDFAPNPNLNGLYTAFGQVVEGREVLDEITTTDPQSNEPLTVINTIVIEEE